MGELTIYVCKMCGRAIKAEQKPKFCYYDRMDSIENISVDDAVKMGLFQYNRGTGGAIDDMPVEFPGDIRWHPMTGEALPFERSGKKLKDFQLAMWAYASGETE